MSYLVMYCFFSFNKIFNFDTFTLIHALLVLSVQNFLINYDPIPPPLVEFGKHITSHPTAISIYSMLTRFDKLLNIMKTIQPKFISVILSIMLLILLVDWAQITICMSGQTV